MFFGNSLIPIRRVHDRVMSRNRRTALARALRRSGDIHRDRAQYSKAESLYKRALVKAGDNASEILAIFNNCAILCKYTGEYDRACELYRQALEMAEHAFGADHVSVATIYHNLGGLEHERGRYSEGDAFARRALCITLREFGPAHPRT